MSGPSPPKPWERAGAGGTSTAATVPTAAEAAASSSSTAAAPSVPVRPASLSSVVNNTAASYSPYSGSSFGASPYGGMGGYGSYSSPYSRFGGMGGMGGYGGYGGGMYGSYGGGMYGGYGGMGGMGPYGRPGDPNSLTNTFNTNTQATFQLIEGIVGAFGGFAQMLESTYMATHSSFFAMIAVAEQFTNLRETLGSVLGIFTLMRWIRTLIAKVTGRPPPADATALTPAAFAKFQGQPAYLPDGTPAPKPSKKPLFFFVLAAFGLPYVMGKMIRALSSSQEAKAREQGMIVGPDGQLQPAPTDPSQLEFCRLMYDFTPEAAQHGGQLQQGIDIEVKRGDFVAVLSKLDPMGQQSEWWRCRTRDGRIGYLPSVYLEIIKRAGEQPKMLTQTEEGMGTPLGGGSRAPTMRSTGRAHTMTTTAPSEAGSSSTQKVPLSAPELKGKPGDISVESFQKSQFYS